MIEGIPVFLVAVVFSVGEIVIPWEMTSFTVKLMYATAGPPELFAQIVNMVRLSNVSDEPEILPLTGSKSK